LSDDIHDSVQSHGEKDLDTARVSTML
jgi:hypothetical protein